MLTVKFAEIYFDECYTISGIKLLRIVYYSSNA